jgi:hypothetical protein
MIGSLKRRRIVAGSAIGLFACVVGAALSASGSAAAHTSSGPPAARASGRPPLAHAAHALRATDTAKLHYVSAAGSELLERGRATGTIPGSMRAQVEIGATISGNFTIYTRGGSIKGHGVATPHGGGIYESFAGSVVVTGGTGRFAHAHGHTGLYGTFDRNTYALTIQTTGTLSY